MFNSQCSLLCNYIKTYLVKGQLKVEFIYFAILSLLVEPLDALINIAPHLHLAHDLTHLACL